MKLFLTVLLVILIVTSTYALESIETIFTRGLNYYIQREFKNAAIEWKKVLDLDPNHTRARTYMERAYSKINATPPTEINTLSLHDALPILHCPQWRDQFL